MKQAPKGRMPAMRVQTTGCMYHTWGNHCRDQREVDFTVWEGNGKEIISCFGVGRKWEGKK